MSYKPKHLAPSDATPTYEAFDLPQLEHLSRIQGSGAHEAVHGPEDPHEHTDEINNPRAERRAKHALRVGAVASFILGSVVEYRYGFGHEVQGLISNALHNFGDTLVHVGRAAVIAARLAGKNSKRRLFREGSAYAMAAVTGASLAHVGDTAFDLIDDPSQAWELNPAVMSPEVATSVCLNSAIAGVLVLGTKGSDMHSEVSSHSGRDVVEAFAMAAAGSNSVLGVAALGATGAWGMGLTNQMVDKVESEEAVACNHAHNLDDVSKQKRSSIRERLRKLDPRYLATSAINLWGDVVDWRYGKIDQERKHVLRRKFIAAGVGIVALGATTYLTHKAGSAPDMDVSAFPDAPSGDGFDIPSTDIPGAIPESPMPEQQIIPQDIHTQVDAWAGQYDPQTGLYDGSVYDTAAEALGVTRTQLEQNAELANEFHELVGEVLSDNNLSWETAEQIQPGHDITISGEQLRAWHLILEEELLMGSKK